MGRFNGYSSISLHFILFICLLFFSFPLGMSQLRTFNCKNDTNYPNGSRYQSNLQSVMDDLLKNAPKTGFNTSSHGKNAEEKVYGLLQCRKDASPQECFQCAQDASITVQQLCKNERGGRVWFYICSLRYDNFSFFSVLDTNLISILSNPKTVKDNPADFQNEVNDLLTTLIDNTSDAGFAAGSATSSSSSVQRVFGLVECWRDLPVDQCQSCLVIGHKRLYPVTFNEGGEALLGSCRIRFEIYPFSSTLFAGSALVHQGTGKSSRNVPIVCGAVASGLLFAFAICLFIMRNKMRSTILERPVLLSQAEDSERRDGVSGSLFNSQMMFSLNTLIEATREFHEDNKLGEGGFGPVYKGTTCDGTEIAVKKLSLRSAQGAREFMNEVKLVAKIQHRNLVQLLGCCVDGQQRLLVYEYLSNKSLDTFLFDPEGRKVVDWQKRYNIIIGIARGLQYLHEDSQLRIIHRDVKASNILLDDKLNPKIADFGLARLFPDDETHVQTRVAGTFGYMAPEYAMLGQLSVKTDVYSFGVVLLEIVSGRRNTDIRLPQEMRNLLEWVWILCNGGNLLNIIDPTIVECCPQEQALRCIQVGLLCIQADVVIRPAMSDVVLMLSKDSVAIPIPTKPAFVSLSCSGSGGSYAPNSQIHLSSSTFSGCNSSSINSLEGR